MVLNVTGVFSLILCVASAYFFHPTFLEHPTYLNPPSMERPSTFPYVVRQRETSHADFPSDNKGQPGQQTYQPFYSASPTVVPQAPSFFHSVQANADFDQSIKGNPFLDSTHFLRGTNLNVLPTIFQNSLLPFNQVTSSI
ncbi:unnamed protein product, partial [Cyprideis torosa]